MLTADARSSAEFTWSPAVALVIDIATCSGSINQEFVSSCVRCPRGTYASSSRLLGGSVI